MFARGWHYGYMMQGRPQIGTSQSIPSFGTQNQSIIRKLLYYSWQSQLLLSQDLIDRHGHEEGNGRPEEWENPRKKEKKAGGVLKTKLWPYLCWSLNATMEFVMHEEKFHGVLYCPLFIELKELAYLTVYDVSAENVRCSSSSVTEVLI